MNEKSITADLSMPDAGRCLMAGELAIIRDYMPNLRRTADPIAVHESRKAIRRSFTLFKLFDPYFEPGELEPYRKGLRRIMRHLAPCRDMAVFRQNLTAFSETSEHSMDQLAAYWTKQQAKLDQELQSFLQIPEVRKFLAGYEQFTRESTGGTHTTINGAPLQMRHVIPSLIYQRLGTVQAFGDILDIATPGQLHQLRIHFKELRYTLTFFEDLLGPKIAKVIDMTRRAQDHLGNLNDADVAIEMLGGCHCCPEEVEIYCNYQKQEIERLIATFPPLYERFNRPKNRRRLALAIAAL